MFSNTSSISAFDSELYDAIQKEENRQEQHIELIASENYASPRVLEAQGSVLTNKYAEGYPSKRYYGGCEYVDIAEDLAIQRVKELYGADYANVQPHSGSQANTAVFLALLNAGDKILGMSLSDGGHLTHGTSVNFSGKLFDAAQYGVNPETGLIDYDEVESLAKKHRPKLLIAGFSAYSRVLDWQKFRDIADSVGAYFLVDMAHVSGLIASGHYPNPVGIADVVTSTTHKTLRGPRGGIILAKENPDLTKKFNSLVFPGTQGGPLMHVIAAKAVAFQEALKPSFKEYIKSVLANAKILSETLKNNGFKIFSGGTDTHLMLVDLRPFKVTGKAAETSLCRANITCNKNGIPFDTEKPTITSGIRLGTQAATTRGFGLNEFKKVGDLITKVIIGLSKNSEDNSKTENEVKKEVLDLCSNFPIYNHLNKD